VPNLRRTCGLNKHYYRHCPFSACRRDRRDGGLREDITGDKEVPFRCNTHVIEARLPHTFSFLGFFFLNFPQQATKRLCFSVSTTSRTRPSADSWLSTQQVTVHLHNHQLPPFVGCQHKKSPTPSSKGRQPGSNVLYAHCSSGIWRWRRRSFLRSEHILFGRSNPLRVVQFSSKFTRFSVASGSVCRMRVGRITAGAGL